jgi:Resolvase, N terminal domain
MPSNSTPSRRQGATSCSSRRHRAHGQIDLSLPRRSTKHVTLAGLVERLDRLARSLRHLIDIADDLNRRRGVALKSITENIDTTTPGGRFMFNILGALSSMEREIIV